MTRRKPGNLEVSAIDRGCLQLVGYYGNGPRGRKSWVALIRAAFEQGVSMLNTAEIYGPYLSEQFFGEALVPARNRVVTATKFGFGMEGQLATLDSRPDHLRRAVDGSLKRQRTDHIGLLYEHRPDPKEPIEDVVGAGKDAIQARKVTHWGLSGATSNTIGRAHAGLPVSAVQSEYAIWWRDPETRIFPRLEEIGIGVVPYCPLGRNLFAGAVNAASRFDPIDRRHNLPRFALETLAKTLALDHQAWGWAERKSTTPTPFASASVLAQRPWVVPIPGTTQYMHLGEKAGAPAVGLTDNDLREFDAGAAKIAVLGGRSPSHRKAFNQGEERLAVDARPLHRRAQASQAAMHAYQRWET